MCGIAGYIDLAKNVDSTTLIGMRDTLTHRGPDAAGVYISDDRNVGLAHRRLSFIDLSDSGIQPMVSANGRYIVSFNGEIYNFKQLREALERDGYVFQSQTDTEVLLHGYDAWKEQLPTYLKGMFAFAVYDDSEKTLFLARDRFGIKPLYYGNTSTCFAFASELKAIFSLPFFPKNIKKESVGKFLANRYVPTPNTMWENVYKLPPAHWMKIKTDTLQIEEKRYWQLVVSAKNERKDAAEIISQKLTKSLEEHLLSDVPIGAFLSGGMDSSALTVLMKQLAYEPLDFFSIGFSGWNESEHEYAKLVADKLHANLHTLLLDKISIETVETLMYYYDDPIADISILPTYAVSGIASKKVKAVVSGEGADESFGGYWWQKPASFYFSSAFHRIKSRVFGKSFAEIKKHYIQAMSMGLFDKEELGRAFTADWQDAVSDDPFAHFDRFEQKGSSTLKQIQFLDIHTFMSELILTKVDRASMAHSLEVRVPFLDHELVEFLFGLPDDSYFDEHIQKREIRKLLQGHVPAIIYERKKQGFVGPDKFYMDMEVYNMLLVGNLIEDGVIRKEYVVDLLAEKDHWRLWKLFVLENWWKIWVKGGESK